MFPASEACNGGSRRAFLRREICDRLKFFPGMTNVKMIMKLTTGSNRRCKIKLNIKAKVSVTNKNVEIWQVKWTLTAETTTVLSAKHNATIWRKKVKNFEKFKRKKVKLWSFFFFLKIPHPAQKVTLNTNCKTIIKQKNTKKDLETFIQKFINNFR